jgi:hypothetical protein
MHEDVVCHPIREASDSIGYTNAAIRGTGTKPRRLIGNVTHREAQFSAEVSVIERLSAEL